MSESRRRFRVEPAQTIGGELVVPGDKSISHRALMLGGIAHGRTAIRGFLPGEDCHATLAAMRAMGVRITEHSPSELTVEGRGMGALAAPAQPLDMGNAGTAMRLFMGLLAGQRFNSTLVGDASLMQRPMERVAVPLRSMGAAIDTEGGRPPVRVHGGRALQGIDYALPVASAQVKSALLLAGLSAAGETRVTEPAPTRDHTERMLGGFGVRVDRDGARVALKGGQTLTATAIDVPGDFSSAAFFLVAGCLAAREGLSIRGVGVNPTRTGLLDMLRLMGADIRVDHARDLSGEPVADLLVRASPLTGIEVPVELVPLAIDELPVLFIAAACAEGDTVVRGARELRVKETDRLAVMAEGLARLGVAHELREDGLTIRGGARVGHAFRGGTIESLGDHRVAMAFAVAALRASEPIEILDVANVATSFPGFSALARSVGWPVTEVTGPA